MAIDGPLAGLTHAVAIGLDSWQHMPMPRYYLNIFNVQGDAPDEEGRDLPNVAAAREEAVAGIRSLLSHETANGRINFRGRIEVADQAGTVLITVPFEDAVTIER